MAGSASLSPEPPGEAQASGLKDTQSIQAGPSTLLFLFLTNLDFMCRSEFNDNLQLGMVYITNVW